LSEENLKDTVVDKDQDFEETQEDAVDGPVKETEANDVIEEEVETELTIEEKLTLAEAKAAEFLDGWQRTQAEFANARKRLERQQVEAYRNATVDHATKILPILDDFDRAFGSAPTTIVEDSWFEGFEMIRRKFTTILEGLKVESIEALGQPFDPRFHEALAQRDLDDVESGIVVEELQTGYRIGDRVIRPSLVFVSA
jgi:molecular chaperone GrpE